MDLQQILCNYLEVAEELENESAAKLIKEFAERNSNQRYELPLIGQFSSGKSATINHLLGRDLLPTKSIETTAFATFISYSESEYAELELSDGSVENISFEEIKQLDNNKVVETGKQIKALNVGINCDLLKSGLTFVDTPGVNTIITTHLEITERILKSAQCIIYVIAKNITDEDALMIQTIEAHNIPVFFVRTRIDDIKKSEEDWQTAIRESENIIAEKLGHPIRFFAISNDTSRSEFENNFNLLVDYLTKEIANDVKEVFEKATIERLEPIRKELEKSLSIHRQTLLQSAGKSIEEIEKQKSKIEALVENWKGKLSAQQTFIKNKAEEVKEDVKRTILSKTDSKIAEFNIVANNSEGDVEELRISLNENLSKASSSMSTKAEGIIQDGADSVCRRLGEEMMSIGSELQTIGLESDCYFDMSVARDYTERLKSIDVEYNAQVALINDLKEKVSQQAGLSEQDRAEIERRISQAEEEIIGYKRNVDVITDSYEPQYVTRQSMLGSIGKKVGTALDIAMLFIPASGWTAAGKYASKIGKTGSMLRKGGKYLAKGARILAKTDAAKDAATLLGGLKNATAKLNGNFKKTSIFDYVSLSYWLEKAGEHFDPSTCELDQEYEHKFQVRKSEAERELRMALEEKNRMIANLAKLNGEKWKAEQEKSEAERQSKELYHKREAIKAELESEKERAVRDSLISQAKQQFAKNINDYAEILTHRTSGMVDNVFSSIINSADLKITGQLDSLSEQLSEIIKDRNECVENKEQRLFYFEDLFSKLKLERG